MNKLIVIGFLGLLLVGGVYFIGTLIQPEQTVILETIKAQIICYGDIC